MLFTALESKQPDLEVTSVPDPSSLVNPQRSSFRGGINSEDYHKEDACSLLCLYPEENLTVRHLQSQAHRKYSFLIPFLLFSLVTHFELVKFSRK